MITINLMPHHLRAQLQERTSLRLHLAIGIGVVCLTVTICWVWGTSLVHHRDRLRQENISQEQRLAIMDTKNQRKEWPSVSRGF